MASNSINQHLLVSTDGAPKSIGPYSQAVIIPASAQLVYTAGQAALHPVTGDLVPGGIEAETRQTLDNICAVLEAANSSLALVVKTNVYLTDMKNFPVMNQIYGEYVHAATAKEVERVKAQGGNISRGAEYVPARTTVQVAGLPKGAVVEIECVATVRT